MSDLEDYAWLTGEEAAQRMREIPPENQPMHRQLQRLRKVVGVQRAGLIVEQLELRQRALTKFGSIADKMFFTDVALQQATDLWTACYKASRLPRDSCIVDCCCGLGGDLLALATRGNIEGWESNERVAHFAKANLEVAKVGASAQIVIGKAEDLSMKQEATWHLDPDRRGKGRRTTHLEGHTPGPETIQRFRKCAPNGLIKLAPATEVPLDWQEEAELEWISWNRECRQLVVWFGSLSQHQGKRRATRVLRTADPWSVPQTHSIVGDPSMRADRALEVGQYVYDVDPAVRAAGLTGALACEQGFHALGSEAGYLCSDVRVDHPLLASFQVLEVLPLRIGSLAKHMRQRGYGSLEIKKRGVGTDPEELRRKLKLSGEESATLLLTKIEEREVAILAQRTLDGVNEEGFNR